jgi:DNA-binding transcriptional ArsR family regulator
MIALEFGQADLLRCRFAISPLWETEAALRCLLYPRPGTVHRPWILAQPPVSSLRLDALPALQPEHGYVPDFLTPPPLGPAPSIDGELSRVRATPPAQAHAEILRAAGPRLSQPGVRRLLNDPARATAQLAEVLQRCWETLVEPYWPRVRGVLEGDLAYRTRRLSDGGVEALLADLHSGVRWTDGCVLVHAPGDLARPLAGQGLLMMPSVFGDPFVNVYTDDPWQPTLIYPARGAASTWLERPPPPVALANLIGRTRAVILGLLGEPSSTSRIAVNAGVSPPAASGHLQVLLAAGLVSKHRVGHEVRYHRTPLGDSLTGGHLMTSPGRL